MSTDIDPIDEYSTRLEVAKDLASQHNYHDAYLTVAAGYEKLTGEYDEAIEEVLRLRKALTEEVYNRNLWRKKATGI
jgi:hypothetical protein